MWPGLNQLLCAALPKEVITGRREARPRISMLEVRTKHLSTKKINKRNLASPFSVRGSHSLQCILDLNDLPPRPVTCPLH